MTRGDEAKWHLFCIQGCGNRARCVEYKTCVYGWYVHRQHSRGPVVRGEPTICGLAHPLTRRHIYQCSNCHRSSAHIGNSKICMSLFACRNGCISKANSAVRSAKKKARAALEPHGLPSILLVASRHARAMLTFRDRHALTTVLLVVAQSVLERIRCAEPISLCSCVAFRRSWTRFVLFLHIAQLKTGVIYPLWMRHVTSLIVHAELRPALGRAVCVGFVCDSLSVYCSSPSRPFETTWSHYKRGAPHLGALRHMFKCVPLSPDRLGSPLSERTDS